MNVKRKKQTFMVMLLGLFLIGSSYGFGQDSKDSGVGALLKALFGGQQYEYEEDEYRYGDPYEDDNYEDGYDGYGDYEGGYGDRYGDEEGPGVYLYKHANFKGSRIFIRAGRNIRSLRSMGWNDKVSSIELVDGARIQIYEHKNYQGGHTTLYRDSIDLVRLRRGVQGNWNDRISSIKVIHSSRSRHYDDYRDDYEDDEIAIFYKHKNRRGSSFEGRLGRNRKIKKRFNDEISSVWVKSGYTLILYEHSNYGGRRVVLEGKGRRFSRRGGSVYNLKDYNFNDRMSSYKLERSKRRYRYKRKR